mmetsp:Transcript_20584/g.50526  ORF Transcript_20584/g.50526 Transcript_20584/m.50526 type:complete len:276 (-) Transcript_20584:68-895(-)
MVSDGDYFSISWGGLLGATVTVLITTLDDSIWLVSFVGTSSLPNQARLVNAATFLSALLGLAILCCTLAVAIEQVLLATATTTTTTDEAEHQQQQSLERTLQWIAVIFCWLLAAGFYIKKQLKRRRRRRQQQQQQQQQEESRLQNDDSDTLEQQQGIGSDYGSLAQQEQEESYAEDKTAAPLRTSQPCTVVMLTTLGFLDEISYFPALVIGQIFSVWELLLGTLLAGIAMLGIQAFLASQCKPFIDFLDDHVKLHGIIALFAFILTIQLMLEYIL